MARKRLARYNWDYTKKCIFNFSLNESALCTESLTVILIHKDAHAVNQSTASTQVNRNIPDLSLSLSLSLLMDEVMTVQMRQRPDFFYIFLIFSG